MGVGIRIAKCYRFVAISTARRYSGRSGRRSPWPSRRGSGWAEGVRDDRAVRNRWRGNHRGSWCRGRASSRSPGRGRGSGTRVGTRAGRHWSQPDGPAHRRRHHAGDGGVVGERPGPPARRAEPSGQPASRTNDRGGALAPAVGALAGRPGGRGGAGHHRVTAAHGRGPAVRSLAGLRRHRGRCRRDEMAPPTTQGPIRSRERGRGRSEAVQATRHAPGASQAPGPARRRRSVGPLADGARLSPRGPFGEGPLGAFSPTEPRPRR